MTSLPILPHGPLHKEQPYSSAKRPSDGDRADRLHELWPIAQKRLWDPRYLWSHLQLKRTFHLDFLKPHEFRLMVPSGVLTHCEQCENICCTGSHSRVSLNLLDIARLLDAKLNEHIKRAPHDIEQQHAKQAAQEDAEASFFFKAFPLLKRDNTHTCSLLQENLHCGAFPHWPLSCERYPFSVNLMNKTVFWAKGCEHQELHHEPEAHARSRQMYHAALQSYNQRIKDVVMLHMVMPELAALGVIDFLKLQGHLGRKAQRALNELSV